MLSELLQYAREAEDPDVAQRFMEQYNRQMAQRKLFWDLCAEADTICDDFAEPEWFECLAKLIADKINLHWKQPEEEAYRYCWGRMETLCQACLRPSNRELLPGDSQVAP